MPSKKSKGGFYAVQNGRNIGIYTTWDECEAQTKGYPGAKYKKFDGLPDAERYAFPDVVSGVSQLISTPTLTPVAVSAPASAGDSKGKKRTFGVEVEDTSNWSIVYSDGACKGNGKPGSVAGIGVWWGHNDDRNLAERCPGDQTNNRAELIAILRVLETLPPASKKPLLIRTDSQYSLNCMKYWIHKWRQNNWQSSKGPVKNAGIIRCLSLYLEIRGRLGQKVILEYVKGHSGETGNDGADMMANMGAMLPPVPERDWNALERRLEKQSAQIRVGGDTTVPFEIIALEDPEDIESEAPSKIRKIAASDIAAVSSSQSRTVKTSSKASSSSTFAPQGIPSTSGPASPTSTRSSIQTRTHTSTSIPSPTPLTVAPINNTPQPASQSKTQRSTTYDHIWHEPNKMPLKVVYFAPPSTDEAKEVNFDDYADCVLSDSDLANELSD